MPISAIRKFEAVSTSDPIFAGDSNGSIVPLLDLALTETNAHGAYLYHFDREATSAQLIAWSGLSPIAATISLDLPAAAIEPHLARNAPMVLQGGAGKHPIFAPLPEFRKSNFEGVVSIPLLEFGETIGMVDICRSREVSLQPREFSFLLSLSAAIGALLSAAAARLTLEREVEKLNQQLADRKVVGRAKGLIQSRFEWTEEQAYFCLRNLSRRKRTPMRVIAEEVLTSGAAHVSSRAKGHNA